MNRQGLLRALIRESILQESVSSDEIIDQILEQVKENREFVAEVLGSDKNKRALLVAAAIAIGIRETGLGTSSTYKYGTDRGEGMLAPLYSKYVQNIVAMHPLWGAATDPSLGVTQIKMSNLSGAVSPGLQKVRDEFGVKTGLAGFKLDDPFVAVLAAAAMLQDLYDQAVSIGYSTKAPGVGGTRPDGTPRVWTSTGNAALDLALTAFNKGAADVIVKYCGEGWKKRACTPQDTDHIKNYIPYFGDQSRNTMFYVTAIARSLPSLLSKARQSV